MKGFYSSLSIAVLLLSGALLGGCAKGMYSFEQGALVAANGGSVTDAGNPAIRPVSIELGARTNASITSLGFCIASVQAFPSDGSAAISATLDFPTVNLTAENNRAIAHANLKNQAYDRIEVGVDSSCRGPSVSVTNGNGTYATTDTAKMVFAGTTMTATTAVIRLTLGDVETALAGVSSNAGIKPAIQGSSGQASSVTMIKFIQSNATSGSVGVPQSLLFNSPASAGDRIVCSAYYDATSPVGVVTDNLGSVYAVLHVSTSGLFNVTTVLSDPLPASGPVTISTNFASTVSVPAYVSCVEYAGIHPTNPIVTSGPFSGTGSIAFTPYALDLGNRLYYSIAAFGGAGQEMTAGTTWRSSALGSAPFRVVDALSLNPAPITPILTTGATTGWSTIQTIFRGQ